VVESQALARDRAAASGAIVRGVEPADLKATPMIVGNIKAGSAAGFGRRPGGRRRGPGRPEARETLGLSPGDPISITSPSGSATAFGTLPIRKTYTIGGVFSVGMSEYDQAFIYMPLTQAQLFFGRDAAVDFIEVNSPIPTRRRL